MEGTKEAIRREMRRQRRSLPPAEVRAASDAILRRATRLKSYRDARVVLAYCSTDGEAATAALIERAFADGKRVFLPRVAGGRMTFAEHRPGLPLRPGAYGIPEPGGIPLDVRSGEPFVAFVPLVAWDASGTRLGRGKGLYDRALAALAPAGCLVGLGYDFQQCPALPRDPWGVPLDWVVTESTAVRCGKGERALPTRKEETKHHGIRGDGPGQPRSGRGSRLGTGSSPAPAR
jgi:5-formyltetrahydrofolate cyclo-ligase